MDDRIKMALGKKASNVALVVNVSLMLLKAFIGLIANSTAIIADAFNNGTDIFATIVVYGGLRIAYLPPDEKHHYGHAKAEPIVSKIVSIIIMITGITIGWTSLQQILSKESEIPGSLAILVSFVSIITKYYLYKYINKVGNSIGSASLVADSFNHRSDVLASSAVLIGVVGARFGFPMLDPIAGLIVSVIIAKTGLSIYMEAIDALMDTAPDFKTLEDIRENTLKTEGVIQINDMKARKHGSKLHIDLKICVSEDISVKEGHNIASNTKRNIKDNIDNVQDIMVHVNPCHNFNIHEKPECDKCKYAVKPNHINDTKIDSRQS